MHYVDSTMVCRSGTGYCSGITGLSKKVERGKTKSEFSYFYQNICYWCSKELSRRNSSFGHM